MYSGKQIKYINIAPTYGGGIIYIDKFSYIIMKTKYINKIKSLYTPVSLAISGAVGAGIHAYSQFAVNNEYVQNIIEDFSNEQYANGIVKTIGPFVLPYVVSLIAGKISKNKAKEEYEEKISKLELILEGGKNDER